MHVYRQPDLAALLPALAPLVPVTGLEQVLGGMLAGLGKQRSTLAASLTGALLTLALNYALVPEHALTGCAWAHIAGHSLTLLMNLRTLIRTARGHSPARGRAAPLHTAGMGKARKGLALLRFRPSTKPCRRSFRCKTVSQPCSEGNIMFLCAKRTAGT